MRKIVLFQSLFALLQVGIFAQTVPYTTSSVQGSTIITNYYDPFAGPSVGPGLPISPLQSRFTGPVLRTQNPTSITSQEAIPFLSSPAPVTTIPTVSQYSSTLGPAPALGGPTTYPGAPPPGAYPVGAAPVYREGLVPVTTPPVEYGAPGMPTYLFPGLVRFAIDQWVGSDYLFGLSPNIGVVVEVVNPNDFTQTIDTDFIKNNIEAMFNYAGINPVAQSLGDQPPLPFFHLLIFATPVENTYVFSISGRLFEAVRLARLNVRLPGTWQAITWEKQELVLATKTLFFEQLMAASRDIAYSFIQRILYFRRQILEQEDQLRLKCGPRVINSPFAPKPVTEEELEALRQTAPPCPPLPPGRVNCSSCR